MVDNDESCDSDSKKYLKEDIGLIENKMKGNDNIRMITTIITSIIDIFGDLTVLEVTALGLRHCCSQYGVTLIIPEGAIEHTATVWFGVCLFSDKFKFEDDYIPVSPIVWIYINCRLIKPAELYIPHHIDVSNVKDINNQLYLLTADDESFIRNEKFTFKKQVDYTVTIESTLVKILTTHFCSQCLATKASVYRDIPKLYSMAKAQKITESSFLIHFCFLYEQPICKEVSCDC